MVVNTSAIVVALIVQQQRQQREREKEKEKEREREESEQAKRKMMSSLLLLCGKDCEMVINQNEKLVSYRILYDKSRDWNKQWVVKDKSNRVVLENSSFAQCLEDAIERLNPKAVSIIPYSVDNEFGIVNGYTLVVTVEECR